MREAAVVSSVLGAARPRAGAASASSARAASSTASAAASSAASSAAATFAGRRVVRAGLLLGCRRRALDAPLRVRVGALRLLPRGFGRARLALGAPATHPRRRLGPRRALALAAPGARHREGRSPMTADATRHDHDVGGARGDEARARGERAGRGPGRRNRRADEHVGRRARATRRAEGCDASSARSTSARRGVDLTSCYFGAQRSMHLSRRDLNPRRTARPCSAAASARGAAPRSPSTPLPPRRTPSSRSGPSP